MMSRRVVSKSLLYVLSTLRTFPRQRIVPEVFNLVRSVSEAATAVSDYLRKFGRQSAVVEMNDVARKASSFDLVG